MNRIAVFAVCLALSGLVTSCTTTVVKETIIKEPVRVPSTVDEAEEFARVRDVAHYEGLGVYWGRKLKPFGDEQGKNYDFVWFLLTGDPKQEGMTEEDLQSAESLEQLESESYYFRVHSSLKRAFQKGFRAGFEHRNADLVLGPNIEEAASILGRASAFHFKLRVDKYQERQKELLAELARVTKEADLAANTEAAIEHCIKAAVELFKELIAEGSPADRDRFKAQFIESFRVFVEDALRQDQAYRGDDKGLLTIGYRLPHKNFDAPFQDARPRDKGASIYAVSQDLAYSGAFGIREADAVWEFVYRRSLRGVGEEMGQKFAHDLIERTALLDWLRRALIALTKEKRAYEREKALIEEGFVEKYGSGGKRVFDSLMKDTALDE